MELTKRCSIVVQGEGKGHYSQALVAIDMLQKEEVIIKRIYLGKSFFRSAPDYFGSEIKLPLTKFYSPNFISSSNRKGINLALSMILNLFLVPIYLFEVCRLGILMRLDESNVVLNFYDPLGALASKYWKRTAERIVISHHFYLSHPDFIHPHGMERSYFWLQFLNNLMIRSAVRVIALSFRTGEQYKKIEIAPPLISDQIKSITTVHGGRDLCYFLNMGYITELGDYYRANSDLIADLFCDEHFKSALPDNMVIHNTSRLYFIKALLESKRVICTAGFDLVSEAFYLGKPVFLIPSDNHYEQYCNALDAARTGMAYQLDELSDLQNVEFDPRSGKKFRKWADSTYSIIN